VLKYDREDLKWAMNTKHSLAKETDNPNYLFCIKLETSNKQIAVKRCEMLINLLAVYSYNMRREGKQNGLIKPGLYKDTK